MDELLAQLTEAIEKSGIAYDVPKITEAYELAKSAHAGQMRVSGEPYLIHPRTSG
jgi:GTP pyrophosphokinase